MRFSTIFATITAIAATVLVSSAAPMPYNRTLTLTVLNYALTLKNLQSEFYKQGLAKFNESAFTGAGFDAKVRNRLYQIGEQEKAHVLILTSNINSMKGKPVPICNYSFPMDNLTQFLGAAQVIETTSVSAYLGAASGLSGDLLTTVGSMTTVEARHAAYLSELRGQSGFPYARDTAIGRRETITIAANFMETCPYNIGVKPFTQLNASLPAAGSNSTMVKTSFDGKWANSTSTYCQFLYGSWVSISPRSNCTLPQNATGYVFVLISRNKTPVTLGKVSNVVAGPTLLFNNSTMPSNNTMPTNSTQSA
ncbi:hypothetical protein BGX29_007018 [Mortierella sp. GBA35]|nr:hypothetical protein BGX29_007018 [Mortierella sp. GBA35]